MSWDPKRKHTRKDRERAAAVIAQAGGVCQIKGPDCTGRATEADHVVPLAEGGSADHMQAACTTCHRAKTAAEAVRGRSMNASRPVRLKAKHPGLRQ